jgi:hypothetical protein
MKIKDLPIASGVLSTDFVVVDTLINGVPATKKATVFAVGFSANLVPVLTPGTVIKTTGAAFAGSRILDDGVNPVTIGGIAVTTDDTLADTTNVLKNAGKVGFNYALNYAASTVGFKAEERRSLLDLMTQAEVNDVRARTRLIDVGPKIQAAVTFAYLTGVSLYGPSGDYRFDNPINFSGSTKKLCLYGDSELSTVFFANFTSTTLRAAFSVNNTTGQRAYIDFRDFQLTGISDPKTIGIFCNWTGSFSTMSRLFVHFFYDGIRIANDYYMKLTGVYSISNLNNGLNIGYDLATVGMPCNNVSIVGGIYDQNGASGVAVYNCRTLSLIGASCEANGYANIYLELVRGCSINGQYVEQNPALGLATVAQVYIKNSSGINLAGLSVSAFGTIGNPIIKVEGSNGVSLSDIAIESSAGGNLNAIGISVVNSFNLCIKNSTIYNVTSGIIMDATSRVRLESCGFITDHAVNTANSANCQLEWIQATTADVATSIFGAASIVDVSYIDGTKNQIGTYKAFQITVNYLDLAAAGRKNFFLHTFPGESWRVADILAVGVAAFAGAGGNRNVSITDGVSTWSALPAATVQTLNFQARWGSTGVPFSAVYSHMVAPSAPGAEIYTVYSGGTTDYTAGSLNVTLVAQRIA